MNMKILGILRAPCFSPGSEERDRAIFAAVTDRIREKGLEVSTVREDELLREYTSDFGSLLAERIKGFSAIYQMARSQSLLHTLSCAEAHGVHVVNSASALLRNDRYTMMSALSRGQVPVAPYTLINLSCLPHLEEERRYWLKRCDACAQTAGDVCAVVGEKELRAALDDYAARGIRDIILSPHLEGDLIKFYGVEGTPFFHSYAACVPGSFSKFGWERYNGTPKGYAFDVSRLKRDADHAARLTGFTVYGGDCVVDGEGNYQIIDFNDWPSFAACLQPAAEAIATRIAGIAGSEIKK